MSRTRQPGICGSTSVGNGDAVVNKISTDGSTLISAMTLGGSEDERPNAIAVNRAGRAAVTGYTTRPMFGPASRLSLTRWVARSSALIRQGPK